jgi:hypothetical protein
MSKTEQSMKRIILNAKSMLDLRQPKKKKGPRTSLSFSSSFTETTRGFNKFKELAAREGLEVTESPRKGELKRKITIRMKK